jgi:hypothetical protein
MLEAEGFVAFVNGREQDDGAGNLVGERVGKDAHVPFPRRRLLLIDRSAQ